MNRILAFALIILLSLLMVWGSSSWYFSKVSRQAFEAHLKQAENLPQMMAIELLDYQETLIGAKAHLVLDTPIAVLLGHPGEIRLLATSLNGPLLVSKTGIRFGASQWRITLDEAEDKVLANTVRSWFDGDLPEVSAQFDFFDQVYIAFNARQLIGAEWQATSVHFQTQLGLANGAYQAEGGASSINWQRGGISVSTPELLFNVSRPASQLGLSAEANAATVDLQLPNLTLKLNNVSSGSPLNLLSRSSLWLNNDTLSGNVELTVKNPALGDDRSGAISAQFRGWRTEGLLDYWRQQSKRASLLQQAEWALEEVETPEQQDFLWRLLDKAERIEQAQGEYLLESLLLADRSQLKLGLALQEAGLAIAQLNLAGGANAYKQHVDLRLEGDFRVDRQTLSPRWESLFQRWRRRLWLKEDENEYEADIKLRDQQWLLNAFRVSASALAAELKRVVADQ